MAATSSGVLAADERGREIFERGVGVVARLRADPHPLSAATARCANCHSRDPSTQDGAGSSPVPATTRSAADRAPLLDAASLVEARRRRNAPASRFDEVSFCRLLATGIDAADVMVRRSMPVYTMSPQDCSALWAFLTTVGERR